MEQNKTVRDTNKELHGFTGTENWYKHRFTGKLFTDGIHHLRETYSCFWLIDDILLFSTKINEPFQVWTLKRVMTMEGETVRGRTDKFELTCDDGNHNVIFTRAYPFSDFEGDVVQLYLCDNVLLLPSEY
jgi:hypothetical protein